MARAGWVARAGWAAGEAGQSLIELALAIPVLLLMLLALADFGRAFYYTTILTDAAREGAAYLAANAGTLGNATQTNTAVKTQVCNATGMFSFNDVACPLNVVITSGSSPGEDVDVSVNYSFRLVSSYLVGRVFSTDPVQITAQARYPGLR